MVSAMWLEQEQSLIIFLLNEHGNRDGNYGVKRTF